MTALHDSFPLSNHRASLAQYLHQIVFPSGSVAQAIIQERVAAKCIGDPVRPALVLWACDAAGGDVVDALPVGAAFDLFDRFFQLHSELTDEGAPAVARWGLGQSLNAGDAFYALAFRTLAADISNPRRRLQAARLVAQAVLKAIDESADARRSAVLTAAALGAGALIGGAKEPAARAFEKAGRLLIESPGDAAAALPPDTSREKLADFKEVVRYVAQRAA